MAGAADFWRVFLFVVVLLLARHAFSMYTVQ